MRSVIEMAREAGAGEPESLYGRTDYVVMTKFELERFADLVRADALVKPCCGDFDKCQQLCMPRAAAQEREVCAEDADWCIQNHLEHLIPERIRARGNK